MTTRCVRKTNCQFCGYLCALEATVEDGRVVDIAPDTTRYPYDEKIIAGCRRWKMNLTTIDGPDRVNYPLRRVGKRGAGVWERVSWDEALDDIAARLKELIAINGPETLASAIGGPHASFWPLHRFMNLLGSPNNMGIGQICWNPRIWMDVLTFGWSIEADIDPAVTEAVVIWGTNPAQSDNSVFWRSLIKMSKDGMPIVVIDPRYTQTAALAELWIAPQPGTDCVLALGLIQVIIAEGLIDATFIDAWCQGFDSLKQHVQRYTPAYVASVCGVPEEDIIKAARIFARAKAAALVSGRGIDQSGQNIAPTHRAIAILRAITGNVDKPGTCVLGSMSDFIPEIELEMSDHLSETARTRCLNTAFTPLQCYEGFEKVRAQTTRMGRVLPMRYMTSAHPSLVWKAVLTDEPYPIRALIVQATNPLLTYADTHTVHEALSSLDLLVVLEYYLTPTAQMADYVLPAAGAMEHPFLQVHGGVANIGYGGPAAVAPYYERRCDYEFFRELGVRMGQGEHWQEKTLEEAYDVCLRRAGVTWDEFCETGMYWRPDPYIKHEALDPATGMPQGFATMSGKIELVSSLIAELGGEELPAPKLVEEANLSGIMPKKGAVVTLITGARKQPYNASMYLNNEDFRKKYPLPVAEMSEQTARRLGLAAGDRVVLATGKGEAVFTLSLARMRDDVVSADYGWWYPERGLGDPGLDGIWESNINLLTSGEVQTGEKLIGSWSYNAIPCKIWKE